MNEEHYGEDGDVHRQTQEHNQGNLDGKIPSMKQEKVDIRMNLAEAADGPMCMLQALSGVREENWQDLKNMASMEHSIAEPQKVRMFFEEV